jgi:hypothetical protein
MFGLRKSRSDRSKLKPLKAVTSVGPRAGAPRLPEGLAAQVADGYPVVDGPHDCLPFNPKMQSRDEPRDTCFWTGDVWKTHVILRALRPDRTIRVLDAYPTCMVLITGFDPESRVLDDAYEAQVARRMDVDITDFGASTNFDPIKIESAHAVVQGLADAAGVPL